MSLLSTTSLTRWTLAALSLFLSLSYTLDLQQAVDPLAFVQNASQVASDMTTITDESTSQSRAAAYPQLVLFGDSITQGCHSTLVPKLGEAYSRRLDVINRGFSGYNTLHAVPILPLIFPNHPGPHQPRVALMTVFFGTTPAIPPPGANDAVLPGNAQHVPLPAYTSHLHTIATHPALPHHHTRLIFLTPPPVNEHQFTESPLQRTAPHTRLYAAACASVARSHSIPVVDVWSAFMSRAGWSPNDDTEKPLPGSRDAPRNEALERLLSDGLHFTAEGYAVVWEELERAIREEVPEMTPEALPMVVPDWKIVMGVE